MQALASIISSLLSLYSFVIVIRIFLSWGSMGAQRFGTFYTYITRITDPYLNLFRGFPGMQRGNLDFSPMLAMIVLGIVNNVLSIFAAQGRISLGLILALITNAVWSVLSFFIVIFIIISIIRIMYEYRRSPNSIQYIAILDNLLRGPQNRIHRMFFGGREISTKTLLFSTTASFVVLHITLKYLFAWLTTALIHLSF